MLILFHSISELNNNWRNDCIEDKFKIIMNKPELRKWKGQYIELFKKPHCFVQLLL